MKDIRYGNVNWVGLVGDKIQDRDLVNTVPNLRASNEGRELELLQASRKNEAPCSSLHENKITFPSSQIYQKNKTFHLTFCLYRF